MKGKRKEGMTMSNRFKLIALTFLAIMLNVMVRNGIAAPPMPSLIKISGYDVGSSAYITVIAATEGWKKKFNIRVRYIPAGTGVARVLSSRVENTHFSALSVDALYAIEGLHDFATSEWGPQPLRQVWQAAKLSGYGVAVRADSGIKTLADLKGKRIPEVVGSPSPNEFIKGALAFAGLTSDDVKIIKIHSFTGMYDALQDGTIDACAHDSFTSAAMKLAASPQGIRWLPMPAEDKQGWARFLKHQPQCRPAPGIRGAGLSEKNPVPLVVMAFPWFLAYANLSDDTAYWIAKAFSESYDLYKDTHAAMPGFKLETMLELPCIFPWHEGAIKYLKEIGKWTGRLEKNQKALIERQRRLQEVWEAVVDQSAKEGVKETAFPKYWLEKHEKVFPELYLPE